MNAAGDFASLANITVYCLNGTEDASQVIKSHFASPRFRIICLSQRLFGATALETAAEWVSNDNSIFRYKSGNGTTIVSFNFSLRDTLDMDAKLRGADVESDVFHVNFVPGIYSAKVVESC